MSWSQGYVTEIAYTHGYYPELNPARVKFALAYAGIAAPEKFTAACELGFGQGMGVVAHGAAQPTTEWWGTDFNPAQAAFAQGLAGDPVRAARLPDQGFDEFCRRGDLPDFDFIALHGIWSWISSENQAILVDFFRRKLKVGGVLYISYNTQPGWADVSPMRHLLKLHADTLGVRAAGVESHIEGGLAFMERLFATDPLYIKANPRAPERLAHLKTQNKTYLAHEYLNGNWRPMPFADAADCLQPAKLDYVASANMLENLDALNLTSAQTSLVQEQRDVTFRETVRDFCTNQQFRRDYWVKGARRLAPAQRDAAFRAQRLVLAAHRSSIVLKARGTLGEADLLPNIYNPILDLMSDYKVRSVGEIELAMAAHGLTGAQAHFSIAMLYGMMVLQPCQEEAVVSAARKTTDRLNAEIIQRAPATVDLTYLASPLTGGATNVSRFQQLFLLAIKAGHKTPEKWADMAWQTMFGNNQRVMKEGKPLDTAEENIAELLVHAKNFAEERLPTLKALGVVA